MTDISFGGTLKLGNKTQVLANGTTGPSLAALVVQKGGRIRLDGTAGIAVGDLTLEDGAIIEVTKDLAAGKGVNVSGNLTVNGQVVVKTDKTFATGTPNVTQLIRLGDAATGTLDPAQFKVESDPFRTDATVSYDAGNKALTLTFFEVITKDKADTSDATSCFLEANKEVWSNDKVPDKDHIYRASNTVYMPTGSSVFPGRTLVQSADIKGVGATGTCTIDDWRLYSNASIEYYFYKGVRFCGKMTTTRKTSDGSTHDDIPIFSRNEALIGIDSEISGDANLRFKVGYSDVNYIATPKARFALTGLNTNFTGKMMFTCPSPVYLNQTDAKAGTNPAGPNATYCAKIWAWDERNFGGPLAAFRYDALEIQYWSVLYVTNDFVFSEPTRGLKATGYARFDVSAGKTLTITNKQVTYAGTLAKEGPGTLVLGGTAKFVNGTYDTPYANEAVLVGTNVLAIKAGALEVVDATATRNLAVDLASGTTLIVKAGATAEQALDVTGVGAGLTLPDGGVPVAFDLADATPGPFSAVICTAKRDDLTFVLPKRVSTDPLWRAYRPQLVKTTADGVTTYAVNAEKNGLTVILR